MKALFTLVCILVGTLTAVTIAQDKSPRQSVEAAPTLTAAVSAFEAVARQRTSTQARTSAMKAGVTPVSRDWEIDSTHLVTKARELSKLKGEARERKTQEVVDHALRLLANDARVGNEDREQETFNAVRGILTALANQK